MPQLPYIVRQLVILLLLVLAGCQTQPPPAAATPTALPAVPSQKGSLPMTTPLNIAHRGARSLAPENTLPAARKALALGADMWELDVAMSADGELVIIHDDTFDRTSNVAKVFPNRRTAKTHEFTLAEMRTIDFGSWFVEKDPFQQIKAGAVTPEEQKSYANTPIPTLREALVFTRDNQWRVNVEIKDIKGSPGEKVIVEKVVALIEELKMSEQVVISSFNHTYLERVRAKSSVIATAALVTLADPDPKALLARLKAQAYNPNVRAIDAAGVRSLRAAGYDVYPWTVNIEDDMRMLIEAGATGIITDFPQVLGPMLKQK